MEVETSSGSVEEYAAGRPFLHIIVVLRVFPRWRLKEKYWK